MYRKGKKGIRMVYYKTHTQLQKIGSNREIEEQQQKKGYT